MHSYAEANLQLRAKLMDEISALKLEVDSLKSSRKRLIRRVIRYRDRNGRLMDANAALVADAADAAELRNKIQDITQCCICFEREFSYFHIDNMFIFQIQVHIEGSVLLIPVVIPCAPSATRSYVTRRRTPGDPNWA